MASQFKTAAYVNIIFLFSPFLMAFTAVIVMSLARFTDINSPFFYLGIVSMLTGWALLVRSKWDQVRKGDLLTWGITKDHPEMRMLYHMSYVVMIAGWLVACFSGVFPHLI
jgi:hypothetical protein